MPLECEHIRNEFSALLDNELNPEDRELVEEHLSDCSDCLRELHGYKVVSDIYRYHHPVKAPEDFEARFHAAIAPIGRKRNFTWQRWGLAAAVGFTLIAGVAVWQSQSRLAKFAAPEMASHLESDSAPQAPPAAEAPQALMFKIPAAESAPESATAPAEQNSNAPVDRYSRDAAAPREEMPSLSTNGMVNRNGSLGGGAMPQAAPAPASEPAASEPAPVNIARKTGEGAADMKSKAMEPASPSAVAKPSPESADSVEVPERVPVEMKLEAAKKEVAGTSETAASAAPAPPAPLTWHEQTFKLADGTWRQENYAGEPVTKIAIPSEAWNALLDKHPDLAKLCERAEPVIVKLGETWYRFARTPTSPDTDATRR